MTKWICTQCKESCTFERNESYFAPERCVYNERGNDKPARWYKSMKFVKEEV